MLLGSSAVWWWADPSPARVLQAALRAADLHENGQFLESEPRIRVDTRLNGSPEVRLDGPMRPAVDTATRGQAVCTACPEDTHVGAKNVQNVRTCAQRRAACQRSSVRSDVPRGEETTYASADGCSD